MITADMISGASKEELKDLRERIKIELTNRKDIEIIKMRNMMKPGDKMMTLGLNPQRHNGKLVEIVKVKKTRVDVQFPDEPFVSSIPINCVQPVEAP